MKKDSDIRRGIIDNEQNLVKNSGGRVNKFDNDVEEGIVEYKKGKIDGDGRFGRKMDLKEEFEKGILIEVRRKMYISEDIMKGVFDEEKGKLLDKYSGENIKLEEEIEKNIIDQDYVNVKENSSGFWKKV